MTVRYNWALNPLPGPTGTHYTAWPGCTANRTALDGVAYIYVSASSPTTPTTLGVDITHAIPAGTRSVTVSADLYPSGGAAAQIVVTALAAGGAVIAEARSTALTEAAWHRRSATCTITTDAASWVVRVVSNGATTGGAISVKQVLVSGQPGAYFDGGSTGMVGVLNRWWGPSHASASLQASIDTTLSHTPGPTVLVATIGADLLATRVQVERMWGSAVEVVRQSATAQVSGGSIAVMDYEPPLGVPVTYRITTYSATGQVLDSALTLPTTVPDIDCSHAWVMDALDPRGAMLLPLLAPSGQGTTHDSPGLSITAPITGGLPVASLRPRSQHTQHLVVETDGRGQGLALLELVSRGGVLVIRPAARAGLMHPTGIIRLAAASVQMPSHLPWTGVAEWTASGVEVQPDAWPDTVPLATWADWGAAMPGVTWQQYADANPGRTWLDVATGGW